MKRLRQQKLEDFINLCETGDVMLFGGTGIFSTIEKIVTQGSYSHVGMIIESKDIQPYLDKYRALHDLPPMPDGTKLIFESTLPDDELHVISGKRKGGPRLVLAESYIKRYYEKDGPGSIIVYRKLIGWRDRIQSEKTREINIKFVSNVVKKTYEEKLEHLAEAFLRVSIFPEFLYYTGDPNQIRPGNDASSFFCSELVASWFKFVLEIPMERAQEYYIPKDFSSCGGPGAIYPLGKEGYPKLGPEIEITI